jgi:hypothetical protein
MAVHVLKPRPLRTIAIQCDAAVLLALCLHSALVANSRVMLEAPQLIGSAVLIDLVLTSARRKSS